MSATFWFSLLAGLLGIVCLVLASDWLRRKVTARRNARDRRIRDELINRYNIGAFMGTKDRHQ